MSEIVVVPFGSAAHAATLILRRAVLREPHDPDFQPDEIESERDYLHLALVSDGAVRACLLLSPLGRGLVQMRQVCVDPGMRRLGLGRRIVAAAERRARDEGFETVAFYAREEAVPFWRAMGYVEAADWFEEVGVPEQMMAKRL